LPIIQNWKMKAVVAVLFICFGIAAAFSPIGQNRAASSLKMGGYAFGINGFDALDVSLHES
jgi:hypothetical protein